MDRISTSRPKDPRPLDQADQLPELNRAVFEAGRNLRVATSNLAFARQQWDSAIAAVRAARTGSAA